MDTHTHGAVIADDGKYFELDGHHLGASAPGFLQRRCYVGVTSPDAFEAVGRFARNPDGRWEASIDTRDDGSGTGVSRLVGAFSDRTNAIVALWRERHAAYCRHKD
jgi:hypothetical protein